MINNKSLGRKILRAMIALVIGLLLVAGSIFALTMKKSSDTLASSNQSLNKNIGEKSSAYMTEQSQKRMLELAREKAEIADQIFLEFERGVCVAASVAEEIYNNPLHPYTKSLISAVPIPDPQIARANKRIPLQGDIPSPLNAPSGCPFRTRCPYAQEKCGASMPEFKEVSKGHFVACHRTEEING